MITVNRLRRVERIASAKREDRRVAIQQRYEAVQDLIRRAEICRENGDLSNEVVRRANRVEELIERGRRRLAESERAGKGRVQ